MPKIYKLKIALYGFKPPIWRRVLTPSDFTLNDLHKIIQTIMPWDNSHLHLFNIGLDNYSDSLDDCKRTKNIKIEKIFSQHKKINYTYDMGDSWEHTITLEDILEVEGGKKYPSCLTIKNTAPIEDFGLDDWFILKDKTHIDYEKVIKYRIKEYGDDEKYLRSIHTDTLDINEINDELQYIFKHKNINKS